MVSRKDKKLLLIAGGAAVLGYFLLRKGEAAITGIATPIAGLPGAIAALPAGIQAGAAALTGGVVDVIGAVGTGAVGGVVESVVGGFEDITRQQIPLRTFAPVPEVRPVLTEATVQLPGLPILVSPQRAAYQEEIGVPIVTSEQYEAMRYGTPAPVSVYNPPVPYQPAPLPPVSQLVKDIWTPVAQPAPLTPAVSSGWAAGRIVGTRTTGGVQYEIVATGTGKETIKRRV